jgi:hypothetical protein
MEEANKVMLRGIVPPINACAMQLMLPRRRVSGRTSGTKVGLLPLLRSVVTWRKYKTGVL